MRFFIVLLSFILAAILQGGAAQAHDGDPYMCPSGKTIMAADLKTPEDVRAFTRCARDFIATHPDHSLQQFKAEFDKPQWKSSSNYVFVDQNTDGARHGGQAQSQIYPPDRNVGATKIYEGTSWPQYLQSWPYFANVYSIVSRWVLTPGEGFTYYEWQDPAKRAKERKVSYVIKVPHRSVRDGFPGTPAPGVPDFDEHDPNGSGFVVGAGVYPPDIQARVGCGASKLAENPSTDMLQNFVRCAARKYVEKISGNVSMRELEKAGFFYQNVKQQIDAEGLDPLRSLNVSTEDLRYRSAASIKYPNTMNTLIYTFAVRVRDGKLAWTTHTRGKTSEGMDPEWVNAVPTMGIPGRDIVKVARDVGEGFFYYNHINPVEAAVSGAANASQRKVVFLKRIQHAGQELLIGSGYYLPDGTVAQPALLEGELDCGMDTAVALGRDVTAGSVETRDDIKAFVKKAKCHIMKVGLRRAQFDFRNPALNSRQSGETEWYSERNNIYLFVDTHESSGARVRLEIYPRNPIGRTPANENGGFRGEGTVYGDYNDAHGNSYYPEVHRITDMMGEAWMYYDFTLPSGGKAWKASYIERFTLGDQEYRIGAGLYEGSNPGACANVSAQELVKAQENARATVDTRTYWGDSRPKRYVNGVDDLAVEVNLKLRTMRDDAMRELQDFVRCAAQEFEKIGDVEMAKQTFVTGTNPAADDADVAARTAGAGKWRSLIELEYKNEKDDDKDGDTNDKVKIKLDGQFHFAPIYTFLYKAGDLYKRDESGKSTGEENLVWGRKASNHQVVLVAQQQYAKKQQELKKAQAALDQCQAQYSSRQFRHLCNSKQSTVDRLQAYMDQQEDANKVEELANANQHIFRETEGGIGTSGAMLREVDLFGEAVIYYTLNDYQYSFKRSTTNSRKGRQLVDNTPTSRANNVPLDDTGKRMRIGVNKRSFIKKVRTRDGQVYYLGAGLYE